MSKKVFAGGLPWEADDSDLSAAFSHFGPVEDAKVIMDKETGKSRGFGFVTFADDADADEACNIGEIEMNIGGRNRTVRIDQANERPERGGGGGGRGRGGGGGGGGRIPGRRVVGALLAIVMGAGACRITPPPANPEVERRRRLAVDETGRTERDMEAARVPAETARAEQALMQAELDAIEDDAQSAVAAHRLAAANASAYADAIESANQLGQQCRKAGVAVDSMGAYVAAHQYLVQWETEPGRDKAIGALEVCRKALVRESWDIGQVDAKETRRAFADAIEDAFDEANQWSRGTLHAKIKGTELHISMRGNFEGRARHSRDQVEAWCDENGAYVFTRITLRNVHGTFGCKPTLTLRDVVGYHLEGAGLSNPWSPPPTGSKPTPVAGTPPPPPTDRLKAVALRARLQQSSADVDAFAQVEVQAQARARAAQAKLAAIDQREEQRRAAWIGDAQTRAKRTQVAGVVLVVLGGTGVLIGGYGAAKSKGFWVFEGTDAQLERERNSNEQLAALGLPVNGSKEAELEDQLNRQRSMIVPGLSVGLPLVALGIVLILAGGAKRRDLRQIASTIQGAAIRF